MDYLIGLPMEYLKWTTLKFVANIDLTILEPEQKMSSIGKHVPNKQCDRSEQLRFLNSQTFIALKSGPLSQNVGFMREFPFVT